MCLFLAKTRRVSERPGVTDTQRSLRASSHSSEVLLASTGCGTLVRHRTAASLARKSLRTTWHSFANRQPNGRLSSSLGAEAAATATHSQGGQDLLGSRSTVPTLAPPASAGTAAGASTPAAAAARCCGHAERAPRASLKGSGVRRHCILDKAGLHPGAGVCLLHPGRGPSASAQLRRW